MKTVFLFFVPSSMEAMTKNAKRGSEFGLLEHDHAQQILSLFLINYLEPAIYLMFRFIAHLQLLCSVGV